MEACTAAWDTDEEAEDFKLRNPSGIAAKKVRNDRDMDSDQEDDDEEEEEVVAANDEDDGWGNNDGSGDEYDDHNESDSDEDGFRGGKIRGEAYESIKSKSKPPKEKKQKSSKKKKMKMLSGIKL